MTEPVSFSVVIPTLGRPDLLATALDELTACCPPPAEVVVVAGEPSEPAAAVVDELSARRPAFDVVLLRTPPGLTVQRNHGLRGASGDVVVFLDDDSHVERDVFARLQALFADPTVVGATGKVVEPDDRDFGRKTSRVRTFLPGGGEEGTFTRYGYPRRLVHVDAPRDVQFMQGCFMAARLEDARALGFDERLPGYGLAEDEDFSCRLSRRGRIRYEPGIVVRHDNTGFATRDRRAFGKQVMVNRTYLFRKNFRPTPLARAQFGMLFGILLAHRLANRDWSGARGLVDGARTAWRARA